MAGSRPSLDKGTDIFLLLGRRGALVTLMILFVHFHAHGSLLHRMKIVGQTASPCTDRDAT